MSEMKDFKKSIARIYGRNGNVVGSGFLVSDRHVLTCAHVVNAIQERDEHVADFPTNTVGLDFPFSSQDRINARIVFRSYAEETGEDIALLEIPLEMLPSIMPKARLIATSNLLNRKCRTYGFPIGVDKGIWSNGLLIDYQAITGWVQMQDTDGRIEPGFSGGLVWDDSLHGVLGMVVARIIDRQQIVFMIPSNMLMGVCRELAYVELENLLRPYEEKLFKVFLYIYGKISDPCYWTSSGSKSVGCLIQELNNMPDSNGYSALVIFATYLVAYLKNDSSIEHTLREELCAWGNKQTDAQFDRIPRRFSESSMLNSMKFNQFNSIEASNANSCLMIVVTKNESRRGVVRYRAEGYFIADIRSYEPKSCDGADQLNVKGQKSFAEIDLNVIIARFMNATIHRGYTIELFLPDDLLNKPIGIDRLPDDDEPISCMCSLIFRSRDRLSPVYRQKYSAVLAEKMREMPMPGDKLAVHVLIKGDGTEYEDTSQELKKLGILGLKFAREPLQGGSNSSLKAMHVSGAPIAIWLRRSLPHIEEAEMDDLLNCCLYDLPHRVFEQRKSAFKDKTGSHMGKHLALLWDDSRRPPPTPRRLKMS
jgi:hypothetical protein